MKLLKNPLTQEYKEIKELVLSTQFAWFYSNYSIENHVDSRYENIPFYSHNILDRPELYNRNYSAPNSPHGEMVINMLNHLLISNNIKIWHWVRISFNAVAPNLARRQTPPHQDHGFPHNNLLIYLTDSGGDTIIGKEVHHPQEDDVIIWPDVPGGDKHHLHEPEKKRRVVLVATYV